MILKERATAAEPEAGGFEEFLNSSGSASPYFKAGTTTTQEPPGGEDIRRVNLRKQQQDPGKLSKD